MTEKKVVVPKEKLSPFKELKEIMRELRSDVRALQKQQITISRKVEPFTLEHIKSCNASYDELKKAMDLMIDKITVLTEVSFTTRMKFPDLTAVVHEAMICALDNPDDWWRKRLKSGDESGLTCAQWRNELLDWYSEHRNWTKSPIQ